MLVVFFRSFTVFSMFVVNTSIQQIIFLVSKNDIHHTHACMLALIKKVELVISNIGIGFHDVVRLL